MNLAKSMTPFNCQERCQAPDSFYSGEPWLRHPKSKEIVLMPDSSNVYAEWQIYTASDTSKLEVYIDSQKYALTLLDGQELRVSLTGIQFLSKAVKIYDKILSLKIEINPLSNFERTRDNYSIKVNPNEIIKVKTAIEAVFQPWAQWSSCSKSCTKEGEPLGKQTRKRDCQEGKNSKITCQKLKQSHSTSEEKNCAVILCPINFSWESWSGWSNCGATCGSSSKTRKRYCIGAKHGGEACPNEYETDSSYCNLTVSRLTKLKSRQALKLHPHTPICPQTSPKHVQYISIPQFVPNIQYISKSSPIRVQYIPKTYPIHLHSPMCPQIFPIHLQFIPNTCSIHP